MPVFELQFYSNFSGLILNWKLERADLLALVCDV